MFTYTQVTVGCCDDVTDAPPTTAAAIEPTTAMLTIETTSDTDTPRPAAAPRVLLSCDFEAETFCGMTQPPETADTYHWRIGSGDTPTPNTGPRAGNNGLFKHYIMTLKYAGLKKILHILVVFFDDIKRTQCTSVFLLR